MSLSALNLLFYLFKTICKPKSNSDQIVAFLGNISLCEIDYQKMNISNSNILIKLFSISEIWIIDTVHVEIKMSRKTKLPCFSKSCKFFSVINPANGGK